MATVLDKANDGSPTGDDVLYLINNPGGTPGDRKATLAALAASAPFSSLYEPLGAGIGWTNVLDHGAVGNGSANDTAAIAAAIAAAGVGGTVFFPAGTYMAVGLNINVADQTWILSTGATVKQRAAGSLLTISAAGVTIDGGMFDADNQAGAGQPIYITGANCSIRNATVKNSALYGIYCFETGGLIVASCRFINNAATAIWVRANASNYYDFLIHGNYIDSSSLNPATTGQDCSGISFYRATGQALHRGTITGNVIHLPTAPTSGATGAIGIVGCSDFTVANNVMDGGNYSISVSASTTVLVQGNIIKNFSHIGIEMAVSSYVTALGNTLDGQPGASASMFAGIDWDGTDHCSAIGNYITGLAANKAAFGIFNNAATTNAVIANNTVKMTDSGVGVNVEGGTVTHHGLVVTGNVLDGAGLAAYGVSFTGAMVEVVVTGNVLRDWTTAAVLAYAGTALTFDDAVIANNIGLSIPSPFFATSGSVVIGARVRLHNNSDPGVAGYSNFAAKLGEFFGTGSPESVVTAGVGSTFHRSDGGAGTCIYVKESGTGNTGWIAK